MKDLFDWKGVEQEVRYYARVSSLERPDSRRLSLSMPRCVAERWRVLLSRTVWSVLRSWNPFLSEGFVWDEIRSTENVWHFSLGYIYVMKRYITFGFRCYYMLLSMFAQNEELNTQFRMRVLNSTFACSKLSKSNIYEEKRLRTVVVISFDHISLLNVRFVLQLPDCGILCAEARDEVALRPEGWGFSMIRFLYVRFLFLVHMISGSIKGGYMLNTSNRYSCQITARHPWLISGLSDNNKLGVFTVMPSGYILKMMFYLLYTIFCKHILLRLWLFPLKKEGGEIQDYASLPSVFLNPEYQSYFVMDFRPWTDAERLPDDFFRYRIMLWINYPEQHVGWGGWQYLACPLSTKMGKGRSGFARRWISARIGWGGREEA